MAMTLPESAGRKSKVIIVGAGFGGIAAAAELMRHGFREVTLLEAAPGLGGTWRHNTYPGAACDVPSHLYSYSFAQRAEWSRLCSPQAEILGYLRTTASTLGVDRRVVTGSRVTACEWDEQACTWTVRSTEPDGSEIERFADALVLATGQLNQPAVPKIPGLDRFEGRSFHSARWDHDYDLSGKRVAVIGTGASAVQFVPEIAPLVGELTVFQRSGNWFMPRRNRAYPAAVQLLFRRVPAARRAWRGVLSRYIESLTLFVRHPRTWGLIGRAQSALFMRRQVKDRELRRKIWPDYAFGCKRVLFSSAFLPALQRENAELVTEPIVRATAKGLETADGRHHEVDCIIFGTGFRANDFMFPMRIKGSGGRTLEKEWAGGAHAHLGMCVPDFPSMFVMYGPNTNTSGGSIIFFLERQALYLRKVLEMARDHGADAVDIRPEVEAAGDRDVQSRFAGTAWTSCDSWYRNDTGRNIANWPGYMSEYAERTRHADPADFTLVTRPGIAEPDAQATARA
jgi:cation diffusion facilitator CzcD-associated flavoprotein CzcO